MLAEITEVVEAVPFEPFEIEMSSGRAHAVPHRDHIMLGQFKVIVKDDLGDFHILPVRQISRISTRDRDVAGFKDPAPQED